MATSESVQRAEGREMLAWILAALGIAGLVAILVTQVPTSTSQARVRFFNGSGTGVTVTVQGNPKKDGSGTAQALLTASVGANGGHAEGLAVTADYERFDVTVDDGTPQSKAYTIDDVTGATKLSDIQFFRKADNTTQVVLRASTSASSPYLTTRVVVLNFP